MNPLIKEDIFKELRVEHDIQRHLLEMLVETSGDSEARRKIFKKLKESLSEHAKFEERFFYRPWMKFDMTMGQARHSVAEHKEIDDLIEVLSDMSYSSTAWLTMAKKLKELVEHHLDEEEREVFPVAGRVLNSSMKVDLAEAYYHEISDIRTDLPSA